MKANINAARIVAPLLLTGCFLLLPACDATNAVEEDPSPMGQWVYREGFDSFDLTITGVSPLQGTAALTSISLCGVITSHWAAAGTFKDPVVTLRFRLLTVVESGEPVPEPDTTLAMHFSGRMDHHGTMGGNLSGTGVGTQYVVFERK